MDTADRKTAYFIMVHHKPAQFAWLLNAIYDPADLFIVHVDLKSRLGLKKDRRGVMRDIQRMCAGKPNIVLMRSRFTNWGGWSLSRILLDAIRLALKRDANWSHFVNLSGQCYPLKPLDVIKCEIAEAGDTVHVEMLPIASLPADDWHLNAHPMFETPLRAFKLSGRRSPPKHFTLSHKGSQWVVLPRAFCEWMRSAPMTARVSAYMRHLLLSDELVMQALALNGPWRGRIARHHGREIVWPGPKVLTIDDLPLLTASPAWFARKFDVDRDESIMLALASANGFSPPDCAGGGR